MSDVGHAINLIISSALLERFRANCMYVIISPDRDRCSLTRTPSVVLLKHMPNCPQLQVIKPASDPKYSGVQVATSVRGSTCRIAWDIVCKTYYLQLCWRTTGTDSGDGTADHHVGTSSWSEDDQICKIIEVRRFPSLFIFYFAHVGTSKNCGRQERHKILMMIQE